MIKGIWNLLFDLPPMLLTIHCRHYMLDQHLFFSLSLSPQTSPSFHHRRPEAHSTHSSTDSNRNLYKHEIIFYRAAAFFSSPFFSTWKWKFSRNHFVQCWIFCGEDWKRERSFFCIIKWKIFNDKFNLDCSTFMKFACEKLNSITRETLISIERFKWRIGWWEDFRMLRR